MNKCTMSKHTIKFDKLIGNQIHKELTDILCNLFGYNNIEILNEKTFEKEFITKYSIKPSFSSCLIVCKCGSFDYEINNYTISIHNSTLSSIYCNTNKQYLPIYQYCNDYKKLVFEN